MKQQTKILLAIILVILLGIYAAYVLYPKKVAAPAPSQQSQEVQKTSRNTNTPTKQQQQAPVLQGNISILSSSTQAKEKPWTPPVISPDSEWSFYGKILTIKNDTMTIKEMLLPNAKATSFQEGTMITTVRTTPATAYNTLTFKNLLPQLSPAPQGKNLLKENYFVMVRGNYLDVKNNLMKANEIDYSSSVPELKN